MIREINGDEYLACFEMMHKSFNQVADELGINQSNCPGHSAFITYKTFISDLEKNVRMYGLFNPELVGCVGLIKKSDVRYKVKYLTIAKIYRHKGYGKDLMSHIEKISSGKIQLGMIYEHKILLDWYISLGYKVDKISSYKKNRFKVAYMEKKLDENL